jgi:hypothetical protein
VYERAGKVHNDDGSDSDSEKTIRYDTIRL